MTNFVIFDQQWIEFGKGNPCPGTRTACPPNTRAMCRYGGKIHPPADWTEEKQPIHVLCNECDKGHVTCPMCGSYYENKPGLADSFQHGLITVGWAVQKWGPLMVRATAKCTSPNPAHLCVGDGWPDWTDGRTVIRHVTSLHDNARVLSLPDEVDLHSLVGQWARGGEIEWEE